MFSTHIRQRFGLIFASLGLGSLSLLAGNPAQAAEEIVITYGFLQQSIAVEDLANFAETGEQTLTLSLLMGASGQDPETVREVLIREVPLKQRLAKQVLYSPPGEAALREVGTVVHHNASDGREEALRAAIMMSAADDRVTLLEIFENYPTDEMYVDGAQLVQMVAKLRPLLEQIGTIQDAIEILGGL